MFLHVGILRTWLVPIALLCPTSLIAGEKSAIPQQLNARIGGFVGYTYQVLLQDGALQYSRLGGGHKPQHSQVRPTAEQWEQFRRDLDAIGVWEWRAEYSTPGVVDGTQWSLEVSYPDRIVKSRGNNGYPEAVPVPSGVPNASKAFTRYLKAVQRLVGGRTFE